MHRFGSLASNILYTGKLCPTLEYYHSVTPFFGIRVVGLADHLLARLDHS